MFRFRGLDGLRGWLAWMVVIDHITLFTGAQTSYGLGRLNDMGSGAVTVFIILSGFVITHLLIEKHEPYRLYIARRFLRIYPIYFLAFAAGVFTTFLMYRFFLGADGIAAHATQHVFQVPNLDHREMDFKATGAHLYEYLLLHLVMLHGVVPNNVLFDSPSMFLKSAWSLSLEWQFYLVAPLVVWAARRRWASIALALACVVLYKLSIEQRFGEFFLPSFLPAAGPYFAIGILCRLAVTRAWGAGSWVAVLILAAYWLRVRPAGEAVVLWGVFFGASLVRAGRSRARGAFERLFAALFDSRLAKHLGNPSYSTYLLHMPVLQAAMVLCVRMSAFTPGQAIAFTAASTIALTYLLSQAAYRWIELPGIRLGKRLGARLSATGDPGSNRGAAEPVRPAPASDDTPAPVRVPEA
ncbi:MAG: acyltransferase [Burkholderiaceae bacterium]